MVKNVIMFNSNGECLDMLENVVLGVKLDKSGNEVWTINVHLLAVCLKTLVQQHLRNLWQMQ